MSMTVFTSGLLAALALGIPAQEPAAVDQPFPASNALAEGVSPEALAELSQFVQTLVDDEEIVGAELLVIKNGRSILHEAFGWRDLEAEAPMETGNVFCVRSMTKPVIGAAILMLVDDNLLELDDHVAQYLPAFDVEGSRDITVEHLLTHTRGLPMSLILGKDLQGLHAQGGILAVADLGAGTELGDGLDAAQLVEILAETQGHGQPTRVREQVFDGDVARAFDLVGRQVLRDAVVKLQHTRIDQHQNRGADDGLGHRAHAEDAAGLHR